MYHRLDNLVTRSVLIVTITMMTLAGCHLFRDAEQELVENTHTLRPIPPSRDAIVLELIFIDRPLNDPDLGERLWNHVDQIGSRSPNLQSRLKKNDIRVGQVAATPPPILQEMLQSSSEFYDRTHASQMDSARDGIHADQTMVNDMHRASIQPLVLPAGTSTNIQTSQPYSHCTLVIRDDEDADIREYKHAQGVLRLTVERQQDGWAKLKFLPQLHHDNVSLRPSPTDDGDDWQFRHGQRIDSLYPLQFEVELNVGEMAIMSVDNRNDYSNEGSLGRHFFITSTSDEMMQRLIVVRLADMQKLKAVYAQE